MAVEGQSDKLKVFISYSRRDAVAADAIVEALQARAVALPLALEGMPDVSSDDPRQRDRPPVAEIQYQLDRAYFSQWWGGCRGMEPGRAPVGNRLLGQYRSDHRGDDGKELIRVAHDDWVWTLAWSPDGQLLATGSRDNMVRIIQAATGKELKRVRHGKLVLAVAWSPDGRLVATGCEDETARLIEAITGKEIIRVAHDHHVTAVAWGTDGRFIATGSVDKSARIIEAATGRVIARFNHNDMVWAVVWSPEGRFLATGSADGIVRIVEPATAKRSPA
jgi:WD40 repeat protein